MNTGRLRGAMVGCGFFGRIQWDAWRQMDDVEMVAACDTIPERVTPLGVPAYADAEKMIRDEHPDFLDIATRPSSRFDLIRLAIAYGIPCICQKPLAESMDQARTIVAMAAESDARVMVHENWRWQPWYREAQRRIVRGDIGQPITYAFRIRQRDGLGDHPYANQPYFAEMPRLLVYETLIHPIDTARFLFGDISSVQARLRRYNQRIAGEDRAIVLLTHVSGMDGIVDGHRFLDPDPPGPAMGDAVFEGESGTLRVQANGDIFIGRPDGHDKGGQDQGEQGKIWSYNGPAGYKGNSVFATQRHFLDCLRSERPFETGVAEYFGSFAAVEAAYLSARAGRAVVL